MRKYLGIEFGKVFEGTFPEFKAVYGSNHIFKKFQPKQREQELKKAYDIATSKDGDISGTTGKSKKNNSEQSE